VLDWNETVFCVVDTETTGTDPESGDRIVEVAIVPVYKGKLIIEKSFVSFVNPEVKIPALIEKVHRIRNSYLKSAPKMREVFPTIRNYLNGMIPVFHNGKFDLTFLDYAAKEIGEFPLSPHYIDTQDLAIEIFGQPKTLEWLAQFFSITDKINHRALDDAIVTAKVFIRLAKMVGINNIGEFLKKWNGALV